jgi:ParB-like chromosome segregation protein Spo0J
MQMTLDLGGICVLQRLRALREEVIAELATSMQDRGQLAPIVVRPRDRGGYWLVAGLHRLEAAKTLEWTGIQAVVLEDVEADQAELAEIDENLIRADLSPAERAQHVGARKAYYEKLHPETKHGGAPGKAGGGKAKGANLASFVGATSKATGQSKRTVKRDATRAKKVTVIDQIIGTSLDTGAELDALAKLPEAEQQQLADRAKAGERVTARELETAFVAKQCETTVEAIKADIKSKLHKILGLSDATLARIDAWCARQDDKPDRAAAISRLVELGLGASEPRRSGNGSVNAAVERAIARSASPPPPSAPPPAPAAEPYPDLPVELDRSIKAIH